MVQSQGGQAVTLEERILYIAEGALNFPDSRELRAIAFEVRKREDRIKQLENNIEKLKDAGDLVFIWLLYNRSHIGGLDVDSALREWKQSKKEAV